MAALSMESKAWRHEWSTEGEQRRKWRTLGALKDDYYYYDYYYYYFYFLYPG